MSRSPIDDTDPPDFGPGDLERLLVALEDRHVAMTDSEVAFCDYVGAQVMAGGIHLAPDEVRLLRELEEEHLA